MGRGQLGLRQKRREKTRSISAAFSGRRTHAEHQSHALGRTRRCRPLRTCHVWTSHCKFRRQRLRVSVRSLLQTVSVMTFLKMYYFMGSACKVAGQEASTRGALLFESSAVSSIRDSLAEMGKSPLFVLRGLLHKSDYYNPQRFLTDPVNDGRQITEFERTRGAPALLGGAPPLRRLATFPWQVGTPTSGRTGRLRRPRFLLYNDHSSTSAGSGVFRLCAREPS